MTFQITEKRTLTCMGCGKTAVVPVTRVMLLSQNIGELFPRCDCGAAEWIDLPEIEEPSDQEQWALMRPALIARGLIIETPYGDMTRDKFREHARVMNDYWNRLGEEMRGFRE